MFKLLYGWIKKMFSILNDSLKRQFSPRPYWNGRNFTRDGLTAYSWLTELSLCSKISGINSFHFKSDIAYSTHLEVTELKLHFSYCVPLLLKFLSIKFVKLFHNAIPLFLESRFNLMPNERWSTPHYHNIHNGRHGSIQFSFITQ
jgi:hypothetical protein